MAVRSREEFAMKTSTLVLASVVLFSGASLMAQGTPQNPPADAAKPISPAATSPIAANDPDYKIGPQDVLTINVWKEPDVSREVPVRPDGKISLPLLNDVEAAGLTPMQL